MARVCTDLSVSQRTCVIVLGSLQHFALMLMVVTPSL